MKITKETKVGILTATAIAILAFGYNFMKGQDMFTTSNEYFGKYDRIEGLFKSNPVLINGYKVGSVTSITMDRNDSFRLTVGITLPDDIKMPKNSIMKIVNNDMIGSKAIEIIFGNSTEFASTGDFLLAEQDQGIAQAVSGVLEPLTKSVNSVLGNIDTAISGADLEGTLKDASLALKSFKETADKLNEADSVIYQTERQLTEFGDKITADAKVAIGEAVAKLKEAHQQQNIDGIRR